MKTKRKMRASSRDRLHPTRVRCRPDSFVAAPLFSAVAIAMLLFLAPSTATAHDVDYPFGAEPDLAVVRQVADLYVTVRNVGPEAIEDLWLKLDIHEPGGAKVENTRTDYLDPDTQELGLLFWLGQGIDLPAGGQVEFSAGYSLWKSVIDHEYLAGDYTLRYRAWSGQPGSPGAEAIGDPREETLTITPISAPDVSVPILVYHRVDDVAQGEYWVSAEEFEAQMKALVAYGYEAVSSGEIYDYNYDDGYLPPRPVTITFDDGYENVYTHAYPVLLDHGFFGEIYIVTGVTSVSAGARSYSKWLDGGILANPHLTWPEIIDMAAGGMLIGSHSRSHRDITTLTDAELEEELAGSKEDLFFNTGIDVTSFAYPFGAGNGDVKIHQFLASYGYKTGLSSWQGLCRTRDADPLGFKRVHIHGPNPVFDPDSSGVSVNYDPANPDDFFMTKLDPNFPVPEIVVEAVEFLDEFGSPREFNSFHAGETMLIRLHARNDGAGAEVTVSLRLDDDGTEPIAYDSHLAAPLGDVSRFFPTTTGEAETFEFLWSVPSDASAGAYGYLVEFHDQTYTLGYSLGEWIGDAFTVCGNVRLLLPADGAFIMQPPGFNWDPGCDNIFVVEFSFYPEFTGARRLTPIISGPEYAFPAAVWDRIPRFRRVYWSVWRADTSGVCPGIRVSEEIRTFRRF